MPDKPKIALYWCASCGGCEETIVDLAATVLEIAAAVDFVLWPVALDYKKHDIEQLADKAILATLINGAIQNSEQEEMVRMLRRKSQHVVAFGACAQLGGIPGLANFSQRSTINDLVFHNLPTLTNGGAEPQSHVRQDAHSLDLPEFFESVRTLDQTIDVDYYIPGCPPTAQVIVPAIQGLITGNLPEKGSVLAPDHALCEDCPRKQTKPEQLELNELHRPHEVIIDPEKCLLAQGIVCLGGSTRSGCDAACVKGNMPCTGCFGPTSRVRDQGAKSSSAIASIVAASEESEIDRILSGVPDPAGTFYRYSFPASLLQRS